LGIPCACFTLYPLRPGGLLLGGNKTEINVYKTFCRGADGIWAIPRRLVEGEKKKLKTKPWRQRGPGTEVFAKR